MAKRYTETEIKVITRLYETFDTPADKLALDRGKTTQFAARFNKTARREWTGPEVVTAVMYLRKQGMLPRLRR